MKRWVALVPLVTLVLLSGCSGDTGDRSPVATSPSSTGEPCLPPASGPPPEQGRATGQPAPDLALACFAGAGEVRLSTLGRPAVVNLWASWCTPCRTELPALDRYAERGTVLVIGVATRDDRPRVQSVVDDLGLGFPTLYDRDAKLLLAVGKVNLPVTLFLSAAGTVAHVHNGAALDTGGFERLAREHLGVA